MIFFAFIIFSFCLSLLCVCCDLVWCTWNSFFSFVASDFVTLIRKNFFFILFICIYVFAAHKASYIHKSNSISLGENARFGTTSCVNESVIQLSLFKIYFPWFFLFISRAHKSQLYKTYWKWWCEAWCLLVVSIFKNFAHEMKVHHGNTRLQKTVRIRFRFQCYCLHFYLSDGDNKRAKKKKKLFK